MDATGFAYAVLLVGALVQVGHWLAPYDNLTEDGCALGYVYDGDTIELLCGGQSETARLVGYDAPETKDPGCPAEAALGKAATQRLRALVTAGDARFSGNARDKYGRLLVSLRIDGRDVGDTLIAEGLAVAYRGGTRINWCNRLGGA